MQTIFEKVKSMNIDEMAEFFMDSWVGFSTESIGVCKIDCGALVYNERRCEKCVKSWLETQYEIYLENKES